MRKLFIVLIVLFSLVTCAHANEGGKIYVVTINDCTVEQVQDVIVDKMTSRNFTIVEMTPYKITFQKDFQTLGYSQYFPQYNLIARDNNVKIIVTMQHHVQTIFGAQGIMRWNVTNLIPIIKEIKSTIDGTPIDNIKNNAVNQLPEAGNTPEKPLGILIFDKAEGEPARIREIKPGSDAAEKGLSAGDFIVEINGITLADMDSTAIRSYLANKWGAGASLVMLADHEGERKVVTLKK